MDYYDYIETNTDDCFYLVTLYGCDSTPSDLLAPKTNLFKNFNEAYEYFIAKSPDLNDNDNYAEQTICYFEPNKLNTKYFIIEERVQTCGYHGGCCDSNNFGFAKRPYGAVLARCTL